MSERERFSVDAETIAALLDGRLRGEERARVLAAIDASPELLDVLGDATEARELLAPSDGSVSERTDAPADPPPAVAAVAPRERPRSETGSPPLTFRRTPRWLFATLAAAAVVVVVSVPLLTRGARATNAKFSTPRVVAALARPAATSAELPATAWGTMRGAGDAASTDGRAVRIGARLVDAQLLNAAGDSTLRGVAAQIAVLLEDIPGAAIEAQPFRQVAANAPGASASDRLREGTSGVEAVVSPDGLRAGAWLETARVASMRGDTSFFSAPVSGGAKSALLSAVRAENRALADSLVAAVSAPSRDMAAISNLSTRLLATLAR